jgi:WD40 repeat protein/DNA-binding Xre family transcriptional regulator
MAASLSASEAGLKIFEQARKLKGWNKTASGKNSPWPLEINKSTLERFHKQQPIQFENFVAICEAVGIGWQDIVDLSESTESKEIVDSNLPIDRSASTELDIFAQQIFDWFGALDFKFEGLPRQEGKYVEWVIQVTVRRSRFDRVLIRATIHEAGLSDLDSLRRGVAQLRVDEGWLVTNLWVSQSVRQALNKSDDENLTCLTFDELIDQDADFTPYLDWLEREISKREIDRYYVDLGCTKGEFDADTRSLRGTSKYSVVDGGIDRYIDRWLENPVTEHVSILGEFGTGKTWFAFHYAGKCLQAYRDAKSKGMPRPRLPLVIPLRDYAKALDVENVFAGFFYTQHNIRLNSEVFDRLNRMGKLLLIFDGFDEMADKIDTQKMTDNFWELAKVVTTNAKVILTCRTEHFPTAQVERDNFGGELMPSTANKITVAPKFETLELMKFDDEQIREVLSRRTNLATVELVMANSQLLDLLRRAVMAEFVLEALPEIEAGKPIDLARVYLYAVRHKMERDITTERTFTSLADKLYFLCELAWEMLSEDKMSINYREFPDRLRVLFKNEVKEQKHLDHWHYDMMGQTMLIRNDDGDYSPAHRSLLEFFVAYKFAAELGLLADDFLEMAKSQSGIDESLPPQFYKWSEYWQRELNDKGERELIAPLAGFQQESIEQLRDTFSEKPLTKAILDLHLPMVDSDGNKQDLLNLIKHTRKLETFNVGYLGGNAATVLVKLYPYAIENQDLNNTNLVYADFSNTSLRNANLSGANLDNCIIDSVFGSINDIVMTHNNLNLITAHKNKIIKIWDLNGRELRELVGHQDAVTSLVLSKDGQLLYSGSGDKTIKEWNLADGNCQRTFKEHDGLVRAICISEDGQLLYSGSGDKTIKEWNLADGNCQRTFENNKNSVQAICISKDGQFLYFGSKDKTIKELNLADGSCHRIFSEHDGWIRAISLSKDGRFLYSGSGDKTIKEWNLVDGNCQRTFKEHDGWVRAISLSKDGRFLYSGSHDLTIKQWKLTDGTCHNTFRGHQDSVKAIVLNSDGKFLYSGGDDCTIKEWSTDNDICQRTFEAYKNHLNTILLTKDNLLIYSGSYNGVIKEWNLADSICKRTFLSHKDCVKVLSLSKDSKFLYSGSEDGSIKKWSLVDGICQRTFEGHLKGVRAVVLSTDGQLLYSGGSDNTIKEWNLADGTCQRTFEDHTGSINELIISSDGQFLYSGSGDCTIKEWNLADGTCQRTFQDHTAWVSSIAISNDGNYLYSCSSDNTIKKWRIADETCQHTFEGHQDWVISIAISSDGIFLYSGSHDRIIYKWKISDGTRQLTFEGHQDCVRAITLSNDENLLYSAGYDGTIKKWDVLTGKSLDAIDPRLCAGANITNVKGLTPAQTDSLLALGAFSDGR